MTSVFRDALEVLGTLELDEVADRILAGFMRATGASGAALWLSRDGGGRVLHAQRGSVGPSPLAYPLLSGVETLGIVHLQLDRDGGALTAQERTAAVALAEAAAVALRNASRFAALRRQTMLDEASGTYHLASIEDHARKELDKARRYGRSVSIAVLSLDGLDDVARELGPESVDAADRAVVASVARAIRDADLLARAGRGEYRLLLPETDRFGALMFLRRAGDELRRSAALAPVSGRFPDLVSIGAATFPRDGDALEALVAVARARQDDDRRSLLRRVASRLPELGFWDLADALVPDAAASGAAQSARFRCEPEAFEAIARELGREVGRCVRARGDAWVGGPGSGVAQFVAALPRLDAASRAADIGLRVHLLTTRSAAEEARPRHPLVEPLPVAEDPSIDRRAFLLFLSDAAAYAAIQGEDGEVFHTCDTPLVDTLVAKLQDHYDLRGPAAP